MGRRRASCVGTGLMVDVPKAVLETAWKAEVRLCLQYRRLLAVGKAKVVAIAAIAREMVGFLWAVARQVQIAPAR